MPGACRVESHASGYKVLVLSIFFGCQRHPKTWIDHAFVAANVSTTRQARGICHFWLWSMLCPVRVNVNVHFHLPNVLE